LLSEDRLPSRVRPREVGAKLGAPAGELEQVEPAFEHEAAEAAAS